MMLDDGVPDQNLLHAVLFVGPVSSGFSNVGVTRCGNLWCHPILFFSYKSDELFWS